MAASAQRSRAGPAHVRTSVRLQHQVEGTKAKQVFVTRHVHHNITKASQSRLGSPSSTPSHVNMHSSFIFRVHSRSSHPLSHQCYVDIISISLSKSISSCPRNASNIPHPPPRPQLRDLRLHHLQPTQTWIPLTKRIHIPLLPSSSTSTRTLHSQGLIHFRLRRTARLQILRFRRRPGSLPTRSANINRWRGRSRWERRRHIGPDIGWFGVG
jgi:hypothetical protein